ncbi:unnamed protein product [Thlaspi arvense]|uniref:dCMP deaminase n=1 Tax=Thlaspi arvense TaxID=13288 RepID=A0AAU9T782_THLAR|nr:unnamed protein product [Thlaspi arvense]
MSRSKCFPVLMLPQVGACLGLAILVFQEVARMTDFLGPRHVLDFAAASFQKSKTGNPLETKYPYVCHAEVNAILNTNHTSAAGQKLYVTMYPCNECAKIIIQSGVTEVIYFVEKRLNDSDIAYVASHKLLAMANIKVRKHQPQMDQILIKFEEDLL